MIFEIGDLLTIVIVGIFLVIYRQLDQNNRSLEKVKKYADKMKDEIGVYVDVRTQDLKNMSIEIDVHQKAAKEILKRITVIENELGGKSEDIDKMFQRVSTYDNAIGELVKMTGRVEENLTRLHKESEFVDKVGKKVRDVSGSLAKLENDLGSIRQDFQKHNLKALDLVRKELIKKSRNDIIKAQERMTEIHTQVEDFSSFMTGLTAKKDDLERDMISVLEGKNREVVHDIDASGNKIHEELMDVWESQQKQFFDAIEKKVAEGFSKGSELQSGFNVLLNETKQALQGYENKIRDSRDVLEKNAAEVLGQSRQKLSGLQKEGMAAFERISNDFAVKMSQLRDEEDAKGTLVIEDLKKLHNELKAAVAETESTISVRLEEFQEQAGRIENAYEGHLRTVAERGKSFEDDIFAKLREHIEKKAKETEKGLLSSIHEIRTNIEDRKQEFISFFGDSRSEITVWRAEVQKQLDDSLAEYGSLAEDFDKRITSSLAELNNRTAGYISEQDAKYRGLKDQLNSSATGFESEIRMKENEFSEKAQERFSELDERITEYEQGLSYKFSKIEEIGTGIDSLEANLKASMDRIADKIRTEFRVFHQEMEGERNTEREKARGDMENIRTSLSEIDEELNALKKRAYDSVSEKLQVFEDEFFEDLKTRDQQMRSSLEEWKNTVDSRLVEQDRTFGERVSGMEEEQSAFIDDRLNALSRLFEERMNGFEETLGVFDRTMKQRIAASDLGVQDLESKMQNELSELKKRSNVIFDGKFNEFADEVDSRFDDYRRKVETDLSSMAESFNTGKTETVGLVEAVRSDVTLWQTQVLQQIKNAENSVRENIADLKGISSETIAAVKEEFISQREDLILNSQEERTRLKGELTDISETILALQEDLRRRSDAALLTFSKESETALLEFQKKARELQMDMEVRAKDFRTGVSDVREKLDAVQVKLLGKLEDEAKILGVNIAEIDKKQKAFIAQTKVFEKADQLKETLQLNIGDLKSEIVRVGELSKEVRDSEKEFDKILRIGEAASAKMGKFLGEKRKLDAMEEDFAKLLNLSQTIDAKLVQMTTTHDTLQHVQADLMKLNKLEEEVADKYKRLDAKNDLLETTTEGVDRNFTIIGEMTESLRKINAEMNAIPADIADLDQRISLLAANRQQAEETIGKLSGLDDLLADIEKRIDAMQEARQWLARTETRLEEVGKQAQEQVKLLGSIMKEGAKRSKGKEKLDTRDVVIRLAREGWSVEEIARTTQLSRSEVELILELVTKKS